MEDNIKDVIVAFIENNYFSKYASEDFAELLGKDVAKFEKAYYDEVMKNEEKES